MFSLTFCQRWLFYVVWYVPCTRSIHMPAGNYIHCGMPDQLYPFEVSFRLLSDIQHLLRHRPWSCCLLKKLKSSHHYHELRSIAEIHTWHREVHTSTFDWREIRQTFLFAIGFRVHPEEAQPTLRLIETSPLIRCITAQSFRTFRHFAFELNEIELFQMNSQIIAWHFQHIARHS